MFKYIKTSFIAIIISLVFELIIHQSNREIDFQLSLISFVFHSLNLIIAIVLAVNYQNPTISRIDNLKKGILISIILANAWALIEHNGSPPILLLDEVTAHLDDDRRQKLHDEILHLNSQVFMTGTDQDLFASFGDLVDKFEVTEINNLSEIVLKN